MIKKTIALAAIALTAIATTAEARDQIRIVGSSTVFPFATAVAEQFGKSSPFKTPVVESTGSGGGMKLFCAGIGLGHPDITNASRRIKNSEFKKCTAKGIRITEVKFGFDGIVLANSKKTAALKISKKQIFQALAQKVPMNGKLVDNPYKKWSDIDPSLPATKIEVLGPPPTSGTRDAFVELAMEGGAKKFPSLKALRKKNKKAFKAIAHAIREDGAFVEAGENDNLIVQKLEANPATTGIFGFSFLDQNGDKIQGALVDDTSPTFENIAGGKYGVSRSLFFYVKQQHVDVVPGIKEFVREFTAEKAWGEDGYLVDKGLIPLPAADRKMISSSANNLSQLNM
ncbi:MAG: PstS family phosphate ABC transporter substrate-binding protein [Rhodospirillaceae bacterium]|nr:PstS family phosphate ABC transporter substrate-binding protein [Rhodospirillaceae bacterium]MBT4587885.1 PstS family phosphate ABC transporter substrate-binding protein [Rhodospirillaceae bacterium]MBT7266622.1 PstS family phosphate ABC transporter substrate-binding protein [Rhodospirillaceae bacterium]